MVQRFLILVQCLWRVRREATWVAFLLLHGLRLCSSLWVPEGTPEAQVIVLWGRAGNHRGGVPDTTIYSSPGWPLRWAGCTF